MRRLRAGFPDVRFTVEQEIADGDVVVLRWTARGTQLGAFEGAPPTGRRANWTGINIARIGCGRITETWSEVDGLGRFRQLGVITDDELRTIGTPTVATPAP